VSIFFWVDRNNSDKEDSLQLAAGSFNADDQKTLLDFALTI